MLRNLARHEIVDTVSQRKDEDATRSVDKRIIKGRTGQDVDELHRVATFLNPSVIPLVLAPVCRLFNALWRILFLVAVVTRGKYHRRGIPCSCSISLDPLRSALHVVGCVAPFAARLLLL